jgi:hypothetical protein
MGGIHEIKIFPRNCSLSGIEIVFNISEAELASDKEQGGIGSALDPQLGCGACSEALVVGWVVLGSKHTFFP